MYKRQVLLEERPLSAAGAAPAAAWLGLAGEETPDGLKIYGETEQREINLPAGSRGREAEVAELYDAVVKGRPVFHGGRWGAATLEACLAMLESAQQRKEIMLSHQVPSPE